MNPKKRGAWTMVFEQIMIKFIDISIDLKHHIEIKEALVQYRYMS